MKKTLILTLALVFVLSIGSAAFAAANPFVDVPAKHWAYDAVSKLAQAGIVDGYNDGTFRGDKTMTRYEMAQIVAKAMAKSDKASAENKALVDKLAVEFAAELQNLGVRVAKLEANQSNLKFAGQADIRYTAKDLNSGASNANVTAGQYRLRLDATAAVDDQTTFGMRLTTNAAKAGTRYTYRSSSFTTFGSDQTSTSVDNNGTVELDRLYVSRNLGVVKTTVGEQSLKIGSTMMIMDPTLYNFTGVSFAGKSGVVNMNAQWGRFQSDVDVYSFELNSKIGKLAYGAGYADLKDNSNASIAAGAGNSIGGAAYAGKDLRKYTYGNLKYTFDKKISLGGEYAKNSADSVFYTDDNDKSMWTANLVYGDQALTKKGDNNITVTYLNAGKNALTRWSNFDFITTAGANASYDAFDVKNLKSWSAQYNYALSKNFTSYLQYVKVTDKDNDDSTANDHGLTWWRVGLTAKF